MDENKFTDINSRFNANLNSPGSLEAPVVNTSVYSASEAEPYTVPPHSSVSRLRFNKRAVLITAGIGTIAGIILIGILGLVLTKNNNNQNKVNNSLGSYASTTSPLSSVKGQADLSVGNAETLAVNGQLLVNKTLVLTPSSTPTTATPGELYYDSATNTPYFYNGSAYVSLTPSALPTHVTSVGGVSGVLALGSSLTVSGNQLSVASNLLQQVNSNTQLPHVSSIQGQSGNVSFAAGNGISINGTTISSTAIQSLQAGNGISVSGNQIVNSGVVALTSTGNSIKITPEGNGVYDLENANGGGSGVASLSSNNNSLSITNDGAGDYNAQIAPTGVSANSYGSASTAAIFTVNAAGQITNVSTTPVSINGNQITSGTISTNYLSSDVALYDRATSNFSGNLQQGGYGVCTTSGNCVGVPGGSIGGSGTSGTISMFTGLGYTIGNSSLNQVDGNLVDSGNLSIQGSGGLIIGSGSATTTIKAASSGTPSFTLPDNTGASGQCLSTDGMGILSFTNCLSGSSSGSAGVSSLNGLSGSLSLTQGTGLTVATGSSSISVGLGTTGVSVGSYGSASTVASFSVNAEGQLTSASSIPIAINGDQITSGTISNSFLENDVALLDNTTSNFTGDLQQDGADVCTTAGNCTGSPGQSIGGGGSTGVLPVFTGSGYTVGNSVLSQSDGDLTDSGYLAVEGSGGLIIGSGTATATLKSGSVSPVTFTLPDSEGTSGQCLSTDGMGVLSFTDCVTGGGGGGVTSLNSLSGALNITQGSSVSVTTGSSSISIGLANSGVAADSYGSASAVANFTVNAEGQITSANSMPIAIDGGQITTGTVGDSFLSSDVALYDNTTSNFTGDLQQNGNDVCTAAGNCTGVAGGSLGGSGSAGTLAMFTGSGYTVGNSALTEDSGDLTASGNLIVQGSGGLTLGTGTATTTILGSSSSAITFTLPGDIGTSGQCLTTDGTSGVLSFSDCLSGSSGGSGGVTSLDGLSGSVGLQDSSGELKFSNSGQNVNIALPQALSMASGPTFASLTLTNPLAIGSGGTGQNTPPSSGDLLIGTSTGTYGLSTLTGNTGVSVTNGSGSIGVGLSTTTVAAGSYGDDADVATFTVNGEGQLTTASSMPIAINGDQITSGTVSNSRLNSDVALYDNATSNFSGTLQQAGSDVCTISGNCVGVSGGAIGGSGAAGDIAMFTGSGYTIGNSALTQDGGNLIDSGNLTVQGSGGLILGSGSDTTTLLSGSSSAISFTLPSDIGTSGQCLTTDGTSGVLSFADCLSGSSGGSGGVASLNGLSGSVNIDQDTGLTVGTSGNNVDIGLSATTVSAGSYGDNADVAAFTVNGEGQLTTASSVPIAINGNQVTSGTIGDNYLNSDVALYDNATSNFSGILQQAGDDVCTTSGNCVGVSGGAIGGSGAAGDIAMFTGSGYTIGNSALTQDGGNLIDSGNLTVQGSGGLILGSGSDTTTLLSGSSSAISFTLPSDIGTSGQCLTTDGTSGVLSFADCLSGSSGGSGGVASLNGLSGSVNLQDTSGILTFTKSGQNIGITLATTTVSPNGYGDPADVATFTVNGEGQLTAAGSTPISINGDQITSGSVAVAQGGTGITSYTQGSLIYASGATTLNQLADGTTGQCLTGTGVTSAPSWGSCGSGLAGSGTSGQIALFNGTNSLTGSVLTQTSGNLTSTGNLLVQPTGGSTTALLVQDASSDDVLKVDTTDDWVGINDANPSASLDVQAGSPAFFDGFESGTLSPFTTSGSTCDTQWYADDNSAYDGLYVARAAWGGNGNCTMTTTQTLSASGTVSFWAYCNNNGTSGNAGLNLYIDSTPTPITCSNAGTSSTYSFPVAAGLHTFAWKAWDTTGYGGAIGELDDIKITNVGIGTAALFSGGDVGIGTAFPGAQLQVVAASATTVGQIDQAATSQTADLLDFENSSGVVMSGFTSNGTLQGGNAIGTNAVGTNLAIAGGEGTGTGNGGNINFNIYGPSGTSGSTNNTTSSTVLSLNGSNGAATFENATNSTTAFQIQNALGGSLLTANTTNSSLTVGQGNLLVLGLGIPTGISVVAGSDQGGTLSGASGTTYYYKVSAIGAAGETLASSESSIAGSSFTPISAPGAPTLALAAGSSLGIGAYKYKVTFVTANGETIGGTEASITTTSGNQSVALSAIPIGPTGTTSRNIYRTAVGGASGSEKLVTTIADNTTTTYTDSTADGSLGASTPGTNTATTNTNNATISWTNIVGATSYRIYRGTSTGGESAYQTSASSPFTDTGAAGTAGTTQTVDQTARLGVGTSSPSANLNVAGTTLLQTPANSTTAFQVQDASSDTVLGVDTADDWVGINDANPTAALAVQASSSGFSDGFESDSLAPFTVSNSVPLSNLTAWEIVTSGAYAGNYSAYAADPNGGNNGSYSHLNLTETFTASGTVSFYYSLSSYNPPGAAGETAFEVDGSMYAAYTSNTSGYTKVSYSVPPGVHTLTWQVYHENNGSAKFSIDDVSVTNVGNANAAATFIGGGVGIGTEFPGNLLSVGALTTASAGAQIAVSTDGTTNSGIVVQDVAGQSAGYAFQLQNSSGISLASIDYQGNLSVQNVSGTGTLTMSSSSLAASLPTTATATTTTGTDPWGVTTGNLCNNGRADLAVTNYGSTTASIYCNTGSTGSAAFSATATTSLTTGSDPEGITTGNLCGNSRADLAVTNYGSATTSIYCNTGSTGSAAFSATATTSLTTGTNPDTVTTGNFCGNGRADLAVTNYGSTTASIYCNTGSTGSAAFFSVATTSLTTGSDPEGITTGNLCGNNRADLAVTNYGSATTSIYCNTGSTGSAAFSATATTSLTTGSDPEGITTGNLCGNNRADLAVTNYGSTTASIYCNTGSTGSAAFFSVATTSLTTGTDPWGVTTGNFCSNGWADLAVTNYGSATASIYCNTGSTGSAAFSSTATTSLTTGSDPVTATTGNFCGNGRTDLVLDDYNGAKTSIYCNTSSSTAPPDLIDLESSSGTLLDNVNVSGDTCILADNGCIVNGAALQVGTSSAFFDGFETDSFLPFTVNNHDTGSGLTPWSVSSGGAYSGNYSAYAVDVSGGTNGGYTQLNLTETLSASGTVSFYYKLSNYAGASGEVAFEVDGSTEADYTSNTSGYTEVSYSVPAGTHTLTWQVYHENNGKASLYIDNVSVTNVENSAAATFSGGDVGIGTASPGNLLSIGALTTASAGAQIAVSTGGATNSGIVVQDVAGQSAGYVFQAQSSTGSTLASIDYLGNLTVQNATITGVLTVNGHIVTANSSGSTTAAVQTNAGTSATCSVTGDDTSGQITLTTGSSGWASGAQCILTFASSYTGAPNPVITPVGTTDPAAVIPTVSSSTTTFTINFINADTSPNTYTWDYFNSQ